jgi:hypothetical protein
MNIINILGYILLLSPFIAMFVFFIKIDGLKEVVFVFGGTLLMVFVVYFGLYLIGK